MKSESSLRAAATIERCSMRRSMAVLAVASASAWAAIYFALSIML